jgi:predicted amidohydrolase YtcJ
MARLGLFASMQPQHFFDDILQGAIGPERSQRLMPWRSLLDAGVPVSFGTDWAAGPINPAYGLLIAALRVDGNGSTRAGPREKIPVEEAIRLWTLGSARNLFLEDEIGSLEPGKQADLVVFNTDLRKMPTLWFLLTHDIGLGTLDHFVDLTMVDGEDVYVRGRSPEEQNQRPPRFKGRAERRRRLQAQSGTL